LGRASEWRYYVSKEAHKLAAFPELEMEVSLLSALGSLEKR